MPSHLRLQSNFGVEAHATYRTSTAQRPTKKAKMSLTQTYYVASTARSKLGKEAGRADHNLRLLVGHANLLDQLMVDLADAERESENWLNQSIREASRPEEPRRVQWMDSIAEDYEVDDESDEESDDELDETEMFTLPAKIKSAPVTISSNAIDEDEDAEYDEDEEEEGLALRRVASQQSPPELTLDDSDSDSEEDDDDYIPASPEDALFQLTEKERQAITTTAFYDLKSQQGIEDYIIQQQQPLIAAC